MLVIRPDSGDPPEVVVKVLDILREYMNHNALHQFSVRVFYCEGSFNLNSFLTTVQYIYVFALQVGNLVVRKTRKDSICYLLTSE